MDIKTVIAGLDNVKENNQKWRGEFSREKDIAVKEEELVKAKIQRCKRERILPELIEGYQKPPGMPFDDYILKADNILSHLRDKLCSQAQHDPDNVTVLENHTVTHVNRLK